MIKYLKIFLLILFFIYIYNLSNITEHFKWSDNWTELDYKARENNNCNPIKIEYKKLGDNIKSYIWTMPKSCEYGLPHTRDTNIIAIPENFPTLFYNGMINHEKIHLNQRLYPTIWKQFYKNYWNYEIFLNPPNDMPNILIKMRRSNPDTDDAPWACWNKIWWSIPIYQDVDNLHFKNVIIKWWNQQNNIIYNDSPQEWINFFGSNINQVEHPHEISAIFLSSNNTIKSLGHTILYNKWNNFLEKLNL